jgi:hypothetical protein
MFTSFRIFIFFICLSVLHSSYSCKKNSLDFSAIPSDVVTAIHPLDAFDFFDARPKNIPNPSDVNIYSAVGCKLKIGYPAESLISFYQEKLKTLGFVPYKDSKWTNGNFKWSTFVDGTVKENPCVYQFCMDWINKDKTRIANLIIRYSSQSSKTTAFCDEEPANDNAVVVIISEPYEWRIK